MNPADGSHLLLIVLVFALVFPIFWMAVTFVLSHVSGWQLLAQHYHSTREPAGQHIHGQSGRLSGVNLSGVLNLVVNPEGVHLSMMAIFSVGSRPLFVPWQDVSASRRKRWFRKVVVLTFTKAPRVALEISPALASQLVTASANRLLVRD